MCPGSLSRKLGWQIMLTLQEEKTFKCTDVKQMQKNYLQIMMIINPPSDAKYYMNKTDATTFCKTLEKIHLPMEVADVVQWGSESGPTQDTR